MHARGEVIEGCITCDYMKVAAEEEYFSSESEYLYHRFQAHKFTTHLEAIVKAYPRAERAEARVLAEAQRDWYRRRFRL